MSGRKKTRISRFSIILSVSALLAWAVCMPTQVLADQSSGMMRSQGGHRGGMHDFVGHTLHSLLRHQKDIGLSAEQSAQIKAIARDYTKTRIQGKAAVKLAEVDVRALIHDEKADLSAIETAMKKAEGAHTALRLESVKALRAAVASLTPEQRDKWRAGMREQHRAARHHAKEESGPDTNTPAKTEG